MTEMYLAGITIDFSKHCPVVVLTDFEKRRALPIWISPIDAEAISAAMGESKPKRPATHDLTEEIIHKLGRRVSSVEFCELHDCTLFAKITLASPDTSEAKISFDARPSDAIALALRFHAPIFVSLEILAAASISTDLDKDEHDALQFKHFVKNLKASDFNHLQKEK